MNVNYLILEETFAIEILGAAWPNSEPSRLNAVGQIPDLPCPTVRFVIPTTRTRPACRSGLKHKKRCGGPAANALPKAA
jgi:hypothetical protein